MFTGIIEYIGKVTAIEENGSNRSFWVESDISNELKPDQSVSHNGVCLTVELVENGHHRVTAVAETLEKTNLDDLQIGDALNLERCLTMNGRLDGHLVQGHVDTTALCVKKENMNGSWIFQFEYPEEFASLLIEKGSISINGISLTAFNVTNRTFEVTIIPYTFEHTNMSRLEVGATVNLEFDMLGKYVQRIMALQNKSYLTTS
jgi:riboflavin synthase